MQKITPFLWFDDQAEEAARFYTSLFDDSRIGEITHYAEGVPGPAGKVMTVHFQLHGQDFIALNGGPQFRFSEAVSMAVRCEDQAEVDRLWEKLTADGGEPQMCGWLKDRYGLSWQIVPTALHELMSDPDPEKAQRVVQAMLQMQKIDVEGLRRAYEGR
jgi:predicted 3-demethylubiquinone-9 3-methyltransferase (glyoxalase superfamily)